MEKVTSTGRETYNSQIGDCLATYTKTITENNVVINVGVTKNGESVYTCGYDQSGNRCNGGFRKFDVVTAEERVSIVTQVMQDLNSIV